MGKTLWLRGTFPARPGSGKSEPHRQRLSLGIGATFQGIKLAEAEAQKISEYLGLDVFDWGKYSKAKEEKQTCSYWVEKFKDKFFASGDPAKRTTTWQGDYWAVFRHLPQDADLTIAVMEKLINEKSVARSRTRKRYCQVLERLGRFAGIECDFSHLQGDYGAASLNPKDIPTDEQIIEAYDRLTNPQWKLLYGILAAYGIRPSEIVHIDRAELPKLIVTGGKTGAREVYPIPAEWVDRFNLTIGELPKISFNDSRQVNQRICGTFKKMGLDFPPQTLRHAYCIRGIVFNLPSEIGAAWAGHALDLHNRVYQRWIQEGTHKAVYERYILRPPTT